MTVEENIERALLARVATLSLSPAIAVIAWPNRAETPPAAPYIRVAHLRNQVDRLFVKGASPHRYQGIVQLTVCTPLDAGPDAGTKAAGQIAAHFPADLALTSEDVRVDIEQAPMVNTSIRADAAWETPVSIRYRALA